MGGLVESRCDPGLRRMVNSATELPGLTGCAAAYSLLNRWAFHRAERTKDAAIARERPKHGVTTTAFVEELTCVRWHRFARLVAAFWTREDGLEDGDR